MGEVLEEQRSGVYVVDRRHRSLGSTICCPDEQGGCVRLREKALDRNEENGTQARWTKLRQARKGC